MVRAVARSPRALDLPLRLADSSAPLRHRVADAVVDALRSGRLRPGDTLPSTRTLAASLGVSRGPVVAAYDELAAAGFLVSRAGSGAVVAAGADVAARAGAATHVPEPGRERPVTPAPPVPAARFDLRPGRPDTSLLDRAAWRRAWRAVGDALPGNDAGEVPRHTLLRGVLADHLRRSRGVVVDPDDLFVVPGVGGSLRALPEAFGLVGRTVALEDPGYVEAWTAFGAEGVRKHPVPVDADGLDPTRLPAEAAAVYVTPSHQYPLGARMPVTRRVALLDWARTTGGLVVEDDYDGEFRYDVSPLPALRSLPGAQDHVAYVGTASKLLAPSLRVAWVAVPRHLRDAFRVAVESRGLVVNEATGLALAELVSSGALAAHHARASRTYAARRGALVAAVADRMPDAVLEGVDAGLHVVLRLPDGTDDHEVARRCAHVGVEVSPLSAYAVESDVRGLVVCYAGLPESSAGDAVELLVAAVTR
ncbi:GntR family transcriptional regulator [Phycicoccus sp. DTK01]|nr:GntR family transcriptional regulator [Phycicoccus sp. DTK01]